jgi:hypothetical protein
MSLWHDPTIPKTGWRCTGITDLGAPTAICGMCEKREIRYAHYLNHPHHDSTLLAGCICAAKLETNASYAKQRERLLKNRARKREQLFDREWRTTRSGNSRLTDTSYQIIIFKKRDLYGWLVVDPDGNKEFANNWHTSETRTALAAFDYVTHRLSGTLICHHHSCSRWVA